MSRASLSTRDIRDALAFIKPAAAELTMAPAWLLRMRAAVKPSPKKLAAKKAERVERAWNRKAHNAETSDIYVEIDKRADGRCEACGIHFAPFRPPHMDHQAGRAKLAQSVQNCWLICFSCDRAKTDNKPSRAFWTEKFVEHCEKHGYRAEAERARRDLAWVEAKNTAPAAPTSLHVSTRQLEVLREIARACDAGLPPTVRELGKALTITNNAVKDHLKALEGKQLIAIEPQKARAIRVTEHGQALLERLGGVQ